MKKIIFFLGLFACCWLIYDKITDWLAHMLITCFPQVVTAIAAVLLWELFLRKLCYARAR